MVGVDKLLSVARQEIGYIEKETNSHLDSKLANAGDNNWTKYARDLDKLGFYNGKKNGYNWCDVFVDWCFVTAFGMDKALAMTYQPKGGLGAGCKYSAQYYAEHGKFFANPQRGDQIFFGTKKNGKVTSWAHTGIVEKVTSSTVYTIEGNTSKAAGMIANGGCVRQKQYSRNYARILGYGRPNWSIADVAKTGVEEMTQDEFNKMFEAALLAHERTLEEDPVAEWAKSSWDTIRCKGLMDGTRPRSTVTRQELAAVIDRLMAR